MKIPKTAYDRIREKLWGVADERNWRTLSNRQKAALYEEWIQDDDVGGVLSRYFDLRSVRVYIKDSIMGPYARQRIKEFGPVRKVLGLPEATSISETYSGPHGRRLPDGKVICWGASKDWKNILFAVFERAYFVKGGVPFAAVIMSPNGKFGQPTYRLMIEEVAAKMGLQNLIWYEP
jgi:hypothetical protein